MIDFLTVNKILVVLVDIISLLLGFWVYAADKKNKVNRIFLILVLSTSLWINLYYLVISSSQVSTATTLARLGHGAVAIFYIPFYLFFVYFLELEKKLRNLTKIIVAVAIALFSLSVFTSQIVKGIDIKISTTDIILGKGAVIFYLTAILLSTLVITLLLKNYIKYPSQQRLKIQYFLMGVFIWISMNFIFNMLLPILVGRNIYYYAQIGNYSAIFLLGFTAFAIVKRNLFGIKVVLTELLVASIAILLFINFIISETTFEYIWKGGLFLTFLVFGWLLVKSVIREIKQREELDKLATELSVVNIRLEGAYDKLQKLDKAKSEFLSIASHQLRAPLTAVKGYVSMMQEGDYGKVPTKMTKPLNNVYDSNERLVNLVNSLLDISRIEAGKIKYEEGEFSMADLLNDIVNEFKMRAETKGLYLNLEIPKPKPANIKGDSAKLRQVVSNLIDNAIKYTEKGGLKVSLQTEPAKTRIVVEDTGEGIEKEDLPKLFQTFSRASAGTKLWTEGTGLGLYVARKFIEMHKGKIRAESPGRGKGSKFVIELPVK